MELLLPASLVIVIALGLFLWRAIRHLYWTTRAAINLREQGVRGPATSEPS